MTKIGGRGETTMTTLNWRSTVVWTTLSLLFLLFALMLSPAPVLAGAGIGEGVGLVLYEVTEDMYLLDSQGKPTASLANAARRAAISQLSGLAKFGTPLCPWEVLALAPGAKGCTVNVAGGDNLSLADGKGTLGGTFAVVVQGDNLVDAPEFVVMTGAFAGAADLSLPFANVAPIGYVTSGQGSIDVDGVSTPAFTFTGTFRLPFALDTAGKHAKPKHKAAAYYLADDFQTPVHVDSDEKSLGWPTVRLEIKF